ncbi:beta-glucosidase 24-like protein, partial [Tanacetum coccineum]
MSHYNNAYDHSSDIKRDEFPDDFIFGVGSSAYQIEDVLRIDRLIGGSADGSSTSGSADGSLGSGPEPTRDWALPWPVID